MRDEERQEHADNFNDSDDNRDEERIIEADRLHESGSVRGNELNTADLLRGEDTDGADEFPEFRAFKQRRPTALTAERFLVVAGLLENSQFALDDLLGVRSALVDFPETLDGFFFTALRDEPSRGFR